MGLAFPQPCPQTGSIAGQPGVSSEWRLGREGPPQSSPCVACECARGPGCRRAACPQPQQPAGRGPGRGGETAAQFALPSGPPPATAPCSRTAGAVGELLADPAGGALPDLCWRGETRATPVGSRVSPFGSAGVSSHRPSRDSPQLRPLVWRGRRRILMIRVCTASLLRSWNCSSSWLKTKCVFGKLGS